MLDWLAIFLLLVKWNAIYGNIVLRNFTNKGDVQYHG